MVDIRPGSRSDVAIHALKDAARTASNVLGPDRGRILIDRDTTGAPRAVVGWSLTSPTILS